MYIKCVGKNIDLELLSSTIVAYFKESGFAVDKYENQNQHIISIRIPRSGRVKVVIEGSPDNFSVESFFVKEKYLYLIPHNLYSLFGGGFFLLNEVRLKEALQNLEEEFKVFLDHVIFRIVNSNRDRVETSNQGRRCIEKDL